MKMKVIMIEIKSINATKIAAFILYTTACFIRCIRIATYSDWVYIKLKIEF